MVFPCSQTPCPNPSPPLRGYFPIAIMTLTQDHLANQEKEGDQVHIFFNRKRGTPIDLSIGTPNG
jgi:hypothetical protein